MAQLKTLAELAPERVTEIPTDLVVTVTPAQGRGTRDKYVWEIDAYGTVTARLYMPVGEQLPTDGLTLNGQKDFDVKSLNRSGRAAMNWGDESDVNAIFLRIDAPASAPFATITVVHA